MINRIIWGALLILSVVSCGKNQDNNYIPYVPVNITVQLNDPRYSFIKNAGGTITLPGGVAGIIAYNNGGNIVAFDRCSSYQPEKQCAVIPDEGLFTATDPCSGSKFSLIDGMPAKAPASRALRTYTVTRSQFELKIFN